MYGLSAEHNVVPDPSVYAQELLPDDQSLFDSSFNDPYKPLKPAHKSDGNYFSKKRPLEAELEEPLAKRPYVPSNDFVERNSPSPVPQNLSHEKRVIVPAGELNKFKLSNFVWELSTLHDTPKRSSVILRSAETLWVGLLHITRWLGFSEVFRALLQGGFRAVLLLNRTPAIQVWPRDVKMRAITR